MKKLPTKIAEILVIAENILDLVHFIQIESKLHEISSNFQSRYDKFQLQPTEVQVNSCVKKYQS
jgi:hypothetical protein